MLLTITTTHRTGDRPRVPAAQEPGGRAHRRPRLRQGARLLPRGDRRRAARRRCCSRSTRSGWCAAGAASQFVSLADYVNDRPYVASSFLSVAIAKLFGTRCRGEATTGPSLPTRRSRWRRTSPRCRAAAATRLLRELFEPLGYEVAADPDRARCGAFPTGATAATSRVTLRGVVRLRDLLRHLYVLLPVLDDDKHYWVERGRDRQAARQGRGAGSPHTRRETHHAALPQAPDAPDARGPRAPLARTSTRAGGAGARTTRRPARAHDQPGRAAHRGRPRRCCAPPMRARCSISAAATGSCCAPCWKDAAFQKIVGVDVSIGALEAAERRLHLDQMSAAAARAAHAAPAALTYRDRRLEGFDAAVALEVIEHLDPARLPALRARAVRGRAPAHGGRDHAERRVQRALRDAAGRARCATATTGSSGRAPSSRRGRAAVAERSRLSRSVPARRRRSTPRSAPPTQMAVFER